MGTYSVAYASYTATATRLCGDTAALRRMVVAEERDALDLDGDVAAAETAGVHEPDGEVCIH